MTPNDNPLLECAIGPIGGAATAALPAEVEALAAADPALRVRIDRQSGRTVLAGQSEQQLERVLAHLIDGLGLWLDVGALQVAYRETIGCCAEIDHTYKRQFGGAGQFARVIILFEPGAPGSGFQFERMVVDGVIPENFIAGVESGLESVKDGGLLAGFPVIDFRAILTDAKFHDVDSSASAFEIAARAAFRELREKGAPKLLEPIMRVEVLTPDEYLGDVIGDLIRRGGQVRDADPGIAALAPLAKLFGYASDLSRLSQGRARFAMHFDHYAPIVMDDPDPHLFPPAAAARA